MVVKLLEYTTTDVCKCRHINYGLYARNVDEVLTPQMLWKIVQVESIVTQYKRLDVNTVKDVVGLLQEMNHNANKTNFV